jgi:ABC-type Fe3+-hydroxamate transport system substrate-binding protein
MVAIGSTWEYRATSNLKLASGSSGSQGPSQPTMPMVREVSGTVQKLTPAAIVPIGSELVRIVSLLPSTTEILFAVAAGNEVVGVTFECDFPPEARSRQIVSTSALPQHLDPAEIDAEVRSRMAAGEDLYHLDDGALRDLAPDLVLTQDLCAVCAVDVGTVDAAIDHLGCAGNVLPWIREAWPTCSTRSPKSARPPDDLPAPTAW